MKHIKSFHFLFSFIFLLSACSDDEPTVPSIKMLPVTISGVNSSYTKEIKYDIQDRIIAIHDDTYIVTINYPSYNEIEVTYPTQTDHYKTEGNMVYLNGQKKMQLNNLGLPVEWIDNKDRTLSYTYDKWGNITSYTYYPWEDDRTRKEIYTSDKKFSPFYCVQSPRWLIDILLYFDFGNYNNPLKSYDEENQSAGYEYEMEYNDEGYPVHIYKSPFGILGANSKEITIEYR